MSRKNSGTASICSNASEKTPLSSGKALSFREQLGEEKFQLYLIIGTSIILAIILTIAVVLEFIFGVPPVEPHGVVATDATICSFIGTTILKKGGNAVDAAIAASVCLSVVNPMSSSLGGGGYLLVGFPKDELVTSIDFRSAAPLAVDPTVYDTDPSLAVKGAKSVAVPGYFLGIRKAHEMFGYLNWKDLIKPSLDLSNNGFEVPKPFADTLDRYSGKLNDVVRDLFTVDGHLAKEGDTMKNLPLGATLKNAAENPEAFFENFFASSILKAIESDGSALTNDDFVAYKLRINEALNYTLDNGVTIFSSGAASGGPLLLSLLNILDYSEDAEVEDVFYHRFVEAAKFAFAQSLQNTDPEHSQDHDVLSWVSQMLDPLTGSAIRKWIAEPTTRDRNFYIDNAYPKDGTTKVVESVATTTGTSSVTVIDNDGTMVALTTSVGSSFGSMVVAEGVLLNNDMGDFSIGEAAKYDVHNTIEGGKRPRSDMAPCISWINDDLCGRHLAVAGVGGSKIPTGVAAVLLGVDKGLTLSQATIKPRLHNQLFPNDLLEAEEGFSNDILTKLEAMGHNVTRDVEFRSAVHSTMRIKDTLSAFTDPRRADQLASDF